MRIPVLKVEWVDLAGWWRTFLWKRRLSACAAHASECGRCENHQSGQPVTPCPRGRELLDRLYPETAEERRAFFEKKDAAA